MNQPEERCEWTEREQGVECVVCPVCAFTFDADHENDTPEGGYTCPLCVEIDLRVKLGALCAAASAYLSAQADVNVSASAGVLTGEDEMRRDDALALLNDLVAGQLRERAA